MERLRAKYDDAGRALATLTEILEQPYTVVVKDFLALMQALLDRTRQKM